MTTKKGAAKEIQQQAPPSSMTAAGSAVRTLVDEKEKERNRKPNFTKNKNVLRSMLNDPHVTDVQGPDEGQSLINILNKVSS